MKRTHDTPAEPAKRHCADIAQLIIEPSLFGSLTPTNQLSAQKRRRVLNLVAHITGSENQLAVQGVLATVDATLWQNLNLMILVDTANEIDSCKTSGSIHGWNTTQDNLPGTTVAAHITVQAAYSFILADCLDRMEQAIPDAHMGFLYATQDPELIESGSTVPNQLKALVLNAQHAQAVWSQADGSTGSSAKMQAFLACNLDLPSELNTLIYCIMHTLMVQRKLKQIQRWASETFPCSLNEQPVQDLLQTWTAIMQ